MGDGFMCQCPERGDPHFYEFWDAEREGYEKVCQCPERGDPHFYTIGANVFIGCEFDVSMP